MSIDTTHTDLEAICRSLAAGTPVAAEVARRIEERADKAREEIKRRGVTDIAVSLIRELRDA